MHYFLKATALLSILMLTACAPMMYKYHEPQVEQGALFSTGCSGSGPADLLRLKLEEGAEFEIRASSLEPGSRPYNFYITIHYSLPESATLKLLNNDIVVSSNGNKIANYNPDEWQTYPLNKMIKQHFPIDTEVTGSTKALKGLFKDRDVHQTYTLQIGGILPKKHETFTVSLPGYKLNKTLYPAKEVDFKFINKLGISPLNC